MKKLLKSLFGGDSKAEQSDVAAPSSRADPATSEAPAPTAAPHDLSIEAITADLVAHVCTTMPDPRPAEEIDARVHMYDAGYVTSISAADLLAHIESRYGLDISETKLIGPLQNLEALAKYIHSPGE